MPAEPKLAIVVQAIGESSVPLDLAFCAEWNVRSGRKSLMRLRKSLPVFRAVQRSRTRYRTRRREGFLRLGTSGSAKERAELPTPSTFRAEPVGEPQELRLIDRRQDCHHRRLDDLILQSSNAERPLSTIRLRNVSSTRWQRSIRVSDHLDGETLVPPITAVNLHCGCGTHCAVGSRNISPPKILSRYTSTCGV